MVGLNEPPDSAEIRRPYIGAAGVFRRDESVRNAPETEKTEIFGVEVALSRLWCGRCS